MRYFLRLTCFGALILPFAGCGLADHSCSLEARTSLVLWVVDAETGDAVDATVTYLVDGEAPSEPPDRGVVGQHYLGLEEEGTFEVTASADGYESVTREYEVTADECHVMTAEETIELPPSS
jgi:hypothetical protein